MSQKIGPYELRGELGRGAMAVVWRGFDTRLEREVAIKEPVMPANADPATASEFAERFVREGKAAAQLNHPGIVTIYSADIYDDRPAIVMELIEGETLAAILERGPLEPASALAVLDQLLDAVGYAHSKGVIHRDIKPDNVFITSDGRVKLADFGIAHVGTSSTLTQAGTVMGTPGYMAPEQVTGQPVDARADLFAIGVIGYEMLTGHNPFGATDGVAATTVMYRIVHEPLPVLTVPAMSSLPPGFAGLLSSAVQKDPDLRVSNAEAFRSALRTGFTDTSEILPSGSPATGTHSSRGAEWASLPVWIAAVGVVLVGGLMLFNSGSTGVVGVRGAEEKPIPKSGQLPVVEIVVSPDVNSVPVGEAILITATSSNPASTTATLYLDGTAVESRSSIPCTFELAFDVAAEHELWVGVAGGMGASAESTHRQIEVVDNNDGDSEAGDESEILDLLNRWDSSLASLDLDTHMSCYASYVDPYFKGGKTNDEIREDKAPAFSKYDSADTSISDVDVQLTGSDSAVVTLVKSNQFFQGSDATRQIDVRQRLELERGAEGWQITAEQDTKVY